MPLPDHIRVTSQWIIDKNHCENSASLRMPGKGNLSLDAKDLFAEHAKSFNYLEGVKALAESRATRARLAGDADDAMDAVELLSRATKVHGGIQAQEASESAKKGSKAEGQAAKRHTGQANLAPSPPAKKQRFATPPKA